MRKIFLSAGIFLSLVFVLFPNQKVLAASQCACYTDLSAANAAVVFKTPGKVLSAKCLDATAANCDITHQKDAISSGSDTKLNPSCHFYNSVAECDAFTAQWQKDLETTKKKGEQDSKVITKEAEGVPSSLSSLINKCGLNVMAKECYDVTVFISLALDLVNYLFGIIGSLALIVFVYGGFVLILSQGNPDKVKTGTGAMINAVIGLVVAFGGYMLVSFVGKVIVVNPELFLK